MSALQTMTGHTFDYWSVNSPYLQIKGGLPYGRNNLRCLSKQDALAALWIDPANTYLAAKTNLQLVVERDITPISPSSSYAHNHSIGFGSGASACGATISNLGAMYTSANTAPNVGTTFYSNAALTTTYGGSNAWWLIQYSTGSYYCCQISGVGVVLAMYNSCSSGFVLT